MKAEVHMTLEDGSEDVVIVTATDPDDFHAKACVVVIERGRKRPVVYCLRR